MVFPPDPADMWNNDGSADLRDRLGVGRKMQPQNVYQKYTPKVRKSANHFFFHICCEK
jgi:hypothetical protein